MIFCHIPLSLQIPSELSNIGVGDRLARAALDWAVEEGRKVTLTHPFLR